MIRKKCNILLFTILMLSSCYSDDSTIATELIPDIAISGLSEEGYSIISYADNYLDITADVSTDYPESELNYRWYLIDKMAEYAVGDEEHPYQWEAIGEGRTLHYNVRLAPGEYEVVVEVKAANDYTVYRKAKLNVTTPFSEGFYILKETAGGNTELDLCNPATGLHMEDCLTAVHGQPLAGIPEALSTTISQGYINDVTNTMASSNIVTVTTKDREICVMRTSDLKVIMNNDNILFTKFEDDEIPYSIVQCMWCNILITNKGVRSQYQSSLDKGESGRFGITNGIHTGRQVAYERNSSCIFLWDPDTKNVVCCDYNGTARHGSKEENNLSTMSSYDCLQIGHCNANGNVVYVLQQQRTGMVWVMTITANFSSGWQMQQLKPIKAYAPHVSQSPVFSVCAAEATLLYGIDDNKLWGYDFVNNVEKELKPEGMAEDETITYVSDQYVGGNSTNNYLIIGTEKEGHYTLRFYKNFGGQPDGKPVFSMTGIGHVRGVRYTTNDSFQSFEQGALMD